MNTEDYKEEDGDEDEGDDEGEAEEKNKTKMTQMINKNNKEELAVKE